MAMRGDRADDEKSFNYKVLFARAVFKIRILYKMAKRKIPIVFQFEIKNNFYLQHRNGLIEKNS